jgi:hypothetical protein
MKISDKQGSGFTVLRPAVGIGAPRGIDLQKVIINGKSKEF